MAVEITGINARTGKDWDRVGLEPERRWFVDINNGDAFNLSGCPFQARFRSRCTKLSPLGGVSHKGCNAMDITLCVGCKDVARDLQIGGFFGVRLLKKDDSDLM